ncbi:putative major facilitator superfamily transporter [Pseudomonas syringae pv. aceris]|nr:putative major facilitator superfamily transporter [Pseudomonas syringae pv. aceris]
MKSLLNVHFVLTGRPVRPGKCSNHAPLFAQRARCFYGYSLALAQDPGTLGHARSAPVGTHRAGPDPVADRRTGAWPRGALSGAVRRQDARPSAVPALGQRLPPQQGFPSPGADGAVAGHSVRPHPGPGPEYCGPERDRQHRHGVHHPVHDPSHRHPAQCPAGHLRTHRTRPHALHQGLRAAVENDPVRLRRDHHRRHPDRPFAHATAVRPRRHVGGHPVGLQRHPALLRRQCATDQQRHAARRRLDRNAAGRRGRRCGGHHPAHRQGAELRQNHRLHPDLAADVRVVPQLARHAAIRRTAHQAQPVHRRQRRALRARRRRTATDANPPAHRLHRPQTGRIARLEPGTRQRRTNVRQPPTHDQHRHLPRLRPGVPEKPRRHQPEHDLHGSPARTHLAGHPAGNLLLHPHHGVGGLRADTGGYFRLSDYGDAGVRVEFVSAA